MSPHALTAAALRSLLGEWRGAAPAYVALAERIRLLTLDGRIALDARLPAERELAEGLGLSRTTVTASYRRLRESGYATSRQGSGTVVGLPGGPRVAPGAASAHLLDFSTAGLPAAEQIAEAARHAAAELPRHLGAPGFDLVGLPELREAIASRYRARGLPTDPEQIMVTNGAQSAIRLLAGVLLRRGDRALIEHPSYPHAMEALRGAGARLVPVNVNTATGWDEDALLAGLRRSSPGLGYLMPDFHNPTGRTMPPEQRVRVLAAAAREGTVIVADETTAELDIDRGPAPLPLAAFGPAVLIGSVGKTLWGGLRIGWIRAERPLLRRLVAARPAGDLGTPLLEQLIVARLLGDWERVLAGRRATLAAGRAGVAAEIAARFPGWELPRVDGGLTVWLGLGAPLSSALALAAREHGLLLAAGPRFGVDGSFERFLRLPIGVPPEQRARAFEALSRAWAEVQRRPLPADPSYRPALV